MQFVEIISLYYDWNFTVTQVCPLIDSKWSVVQLIIWHRKGDKLLPEVMVTYVTDAEAPMI